MSRMTETSAGGSRGSFNDVYLESDGCNRSRPVGAGSTPPIAQRIDSTPPYLIRIYAAFLTISFISGFSLIRPRIQAISPLRAHLPVEAELLSQSGILPGNGHP